VPVLTKLLSHQDHEVRRNTAWALWKISKHKESIAVLEKCLLYRHVPNFPGAEEKDDESQLRVDSWAVKMLGEIGPDAKPAIPALLKALERAKTEIKLAAIYRYEGYATEETCSAILQALHQIDAANYSAPKQKATYSAPK
jgi:HEAT repeat protein